MAQIPHTEKAATNEFIGQLADAISIFGIVIDVVLYINKITTDEPPDPFMVSLNRIHAKLSEIDDNVLASWVSTREANVTFVVAHSSTALQTANEFVKSGATASDPIWSPRLALALRDSLLAVQTFTSDIEKGFWRRPDSVKAISWQAENPADFMHGWMQHMPDRAERDNFSAVWDYRWALPVALYTISIRIAVLLAAKEKIENVKQEINRYNNFVNKVIKKMLSGVRSVGKLTDEQLNNIPTIGLPIAVADIYGGFFIGGIADPHTLKFANTLANKIPIPPDVRVGDLHLNALLDSKDKIQRDWAVIVREAIGIFELFRFSGGLDNILKALDEQSAKLSTLRDKGIDFSVPEGDLLDWLNDPVNTSYPAIIEALLGRLGDKRLRKPVFLDVIVFNYEHTPEFPAGLPSSPRKLTEVFAPVLRKAVLAGYNERYGENVTEFQSLLV